MVTSKRLALLYGHIDEGSLFEALTGLDRVALWKGAAAVLSANIGNLSFASACRSGLMRVSDRAEESEAVLISESDVTCKLGYQPADLRLVERFIDCINPQRSQHSHRLSKWITSSARRDPRSTLQLLEKLAAKLEEFDRHRIWMDDEAIAAAMLEILREADESNDADLIHRAIALQDRFLALGLRSAEKMLERAVSS